MNGEQEIIPIQEREGSVIEAFLSQRDEQSFTVLFAALSPQLIAFFQVRTRDMALAEDLTQEVMFTAYRKVAQIRDRSLFRPWLFTIARNALSRHYGQMSRRIQAMCFDELHETVLVERRPYMGSPAFEFLGWMDHLQPKEREVMVLRFVEDWEYHEISAARSIPIGTVQWMVFNSKKKLKNLLETRRVCLHDRR